MVNARAVSAFLFVVLWVIGCGKDEPPSARKEIKPLKIGSYHFAAGISEEVTRSLGHDLQSLDQLTISPDPELQRILRIQDLSPKSLSDWLAARVHYFLFAESKNFSLKGVKLKNHSLRYPNAELPDVEEQENKDPLPGGKELFPIMANLSAGAYLFAKQKGIFLGVPIAGWGIVPLLSPRIGLVLLCRFPGLFDPLYTQLAERPEALAIQTLSFLFHEARHSDGTKKHLGYAHGNCSDEQQYPGRLICDKNGNGPYSIGGYFLRAATDACQTCTTKEKDVLTTLYLDSLERVVPSMRDVFWDDRPEWMIPATRDEK